MTPVSSITLTAASSPRSASDSGPMYPAPGPLEPIPSDAMTPYDPSLHGASCGRFSESCVAKITLPRHEQSANRGADVKFSATVHNVQHLLPGTRDAGHSSGNLIANRADDGPILSTRSHRGRS